MESTGNEYDHEVPGAGEVHEAGEHVRCSAQGLAPRIPLDSD